MVGRHVSRLRGQKFLLVHGSHNTFSCLSKNLLSKLVVIHGEAGRDEVLVDDMTRQVKAGLSDEPGIYLNFDPERAVPATAAY